MLEQVLCAFEQSRYACRASFVLMYLVCMDVVAVALGYRNLAAARISGLQAGLCTSYRNCHSAFRLSHLLYSWLATPSTTKFTFKTFGHGCKSQARTDSAGGSGVLEHARCIYMV